MLYIIYLLLYIFNNNTSENYQWGGSPDQINWPLFTEN